MATKRIIFTEYEKKILINLVTSSIHIIEDKRNDAVVIAVKQQEWDKIAEKFNCHCDVRTFTTQQLKKCWMNLKARSKKEFCRERKEGMLHGQGTPPTLVDSMSHRIYDLLPEKFEPLDNPNDNDETCTETLPVVLPQLDNNEAFKQAEYIKGMHGTPFKASSGNYILLQNSSQLPSSKKYFVAMKSTKQDVDVDFDQVRDESHGADIKNPQQPKSASSSNLGKRQLSDNCKESLLVRQQNLEHELRVKKLKLEIEFAKEEHVAKMRQLAQNSNEPLSSYCKHCDH